MRLYQLFAVALTALLAVPPGLPLAAQETRVAGADHVPPPATIAEAEWLVGDWVGEGIGGAEAHEFWIPPTGPTMVGLFVQEKPDGTIMFSEHMYLTEEAGSLMVKLKHFNVDLTGWEEKDGMVRFRLLSIEPCAAYFSSLTYRCTTDPETGEEGLLVAVRMRSEGDRVNELIFRFKRRPAPQQEAASAGKGCDGSTIEINQCLASTLARADDQRKAYFDAAIGEADPQSEVVRQMRASESDFEAYREHECSAVYEQWKDGTIRNAMYLRCAIRLTDERTHTIWQNWLTYQDSTSPILPEPTSTP